MGDFFFGFRGDGVGGDRGVGFFVLVGVGWLGFEILDFVFVGVESGGLDIFGGKRCGYDRGKVVWNNLGSFIFFCGIGGYIL